MLLSEIFCSLITSCELSQHNSLHITTTYDGDFFLFVESGERAERDPVALFTCARTSIRPGNVHYREVFYFVRRLGAMPI